MKTKLPAARAVAGLWLVGLCLTACLAGQMAQESAGGSDRPAAPENRLLVAAASDLQFAFGEMGALYREKSGQEVSFTFGSTGNLASQIENGAPFDIFAAANVEFVERLAGQGLVIPDTQQLYAQGRIALVVNRAAGVEAAELNDLLDPSLSRIAIANPAHAPYGKAAQEALQSVGIWEDIQPKLVLGENVRQALQFVQTGDAQAGIVALSVADTPEVSYTLLEADLHQPLNQALAVIKGTPREAAARTFIKLANSPDGRQIMKKYGFLLPGEF